jgi:NAD(P)-dependent dehydrogenase (short-subunit alcohol dehydrogenase family)
MVSIYDFIVHQLLGFSRKPKGLLPEDLRKSLVNQVAIVTGSNTGIGKATAIALAARGATVILACRDEKKGLEAANEINLRLKLFNASEFPFALKGKAKFMRLDLSDLHSVFDFAMAYKEEYTKLDILVNNAGINTDGLLSNGLEQLFQVNYLGHYLLYRCLENHLRRSDGSSNNNNNTNKAARVINLSSVMHHFGQYNFRLSALRKFSLIMRYLLGYSYYDDSKLFMNFLTMAINQRNDQYQNYLFSVQQEVKANSNNGNSPRPQNTMSREILAVSVNPGAVASDIWRNVPFQSVFQAITNYVFLNTADGSKTSVYAALIDEKIIKNYRCSSTTVSATTSTSTSHSSNLVQYKDIPYLIPYHMYWRTIFFELLGHSFHTPEFSGISLPQRHSDLIENSIRNPELHVKFSNVNELSFLLWKFSSELCYRLLIHSGVSTEELEFLK